MEPRSCPSLSAQLIAPRVIQSPAFYFIDLSFVNHHKQKLPVPNDSSIWVESVAFWRRELRCSGEGRELCSSSLACLARGDGTHSLKADSETR